jgi:hypothetical protein
MTNALAVLNSGKLALSDLEQAILEEAAHDAAAYDPIPTRLTISPGGTNILMTSDGEALKALTGIIVISQKARVYWPEKGSGTPPMCSSPDGAHGYLALEPTDAQWKAAGTARQPHPALPILDNGEELPAAIACAACPLSQFGSAHQGGTGKGQACKSLRRLVVLADGWAQPALFTLPPTSIKSFDTYASSLARGRSAYFAVRTKITLEAQKSGNGDPYSVATFSQAGALSEGEIAAVIDIRRQFEALVRTMPIDSTDYDSAPPMQTGDPTDANGVPLPF